MESGAAPFDELHNWIDIRVSQHLDVIANQLLTDVRAQLERHHERLVQVMVTLGTISSIRYENGYEGSSQQKKCMYW